MVRRTLLTASAIGLLAASLASARSDLPSADKRAGIEKAKNAGIKVDPAMEPLMERAPIGSCANDPTLPRCPQARAVVYSPEFFGLSDDDRLMNAKRSRSVARVAQVPQCGLNVKESSPDKFYGQARMISQNVCSGAVTSHELYSQLKKFWNSGWVQMATGFLQGEGGQGLYRTDYYRCTITSERFWRAQADAFALLNGVWWGATQARQRYLNCG